MNKRLMAALALSLTAVAPLAGAAGLGFIGQGPMARFNQADMKLFNGALDQALKAPQPGTPVAWANERTSASGTVTPERLFEDKGQPCRELRIVNRHRQLEASGVFTMCRGEGGWKLAQ